MSALPYWNVVLLAAPRSNFLTKFPYYYHIIFNCSLAYGRHVVVENGNVWDRTMQISNTSNIYPSYIHTYIYMYIASTPVFCSVSSEIHKPIHSHKTL